MPKKTAKSKRGRGGPETSQARVMEEEFPREEEERATLELARSMEEERNEVREEMDEGEGEEEQEWLDNEKKVLYSFRASKEEKIVEFFSNNNCFYNKSHPNYLNQTNKDKLLAGLSKKLDSNAKKIIGW
ncbi:uncharacterized protein LOC106177005 [Lingula anatina]|uniref:Uncharacterized protein LOC106177005 n=1 Tax=Lingula anatina TaxID=7574 RepID=A0A1S3JXC7_LINAN|nr:uncharacterized protein LOC106177005 [Lingula anatina]|eukprot:XP_013415080.1 uncharacterized protein LOC106177005 [Lingula anatina]